MLSIVAGDGQGLGSLLLGSLLSGEASRSRQVVLQNFCLKAQLL